MRMLHRSNIEDLMHSRSIREEGREHCKYCDESEREREKESDGKRRRELLLLSGNELSIDREKLSHFAVSRVIAIPAKFYGPEMI